MEAIFNLGNVYFDILSLIALVLLLLTSIEGCIKGFAYSFIKIVKNIIILVTSFVLAKPLANILLNLSFAIDLENQLINGLENMGEIFAQPLPSGEELETIRMSLENLNLPPMFSEPLTNFVSSLNSSLQGENLATLLGHGIMQYFAIFVSFIIISLILSIIFSLILRVAKRVNDKKVIGGVNRLLGFILGLVICYIKIDILIYILSVGMMINSDVHEFIRQTIYLDSNEIFTLIKFIYNHNITGFIIGALLK